MSSKVTGSHRGWMLTINNPKIPLLAYLEQWLSDGLIVFGIGQTEIGKNGTPHHQVYIVTKPNDKNKNGFTLKWVKENIHSTGHWEDRRGSHDDACNYCTKEDTRADGDDAGPFTVGEWSDTEGQKKGGTQHKNSVEALLKDVKNGMTDRQLLDKYPRLAITMTKGIEKARLVYAQDHPRIQPYVVVLHGPTGTGKSHRANEIMKNNGGGFVFRKGNSGNMWADGYDPLRHPVVWFDEMDGGFMPYRQLLRVCDKWPLVLDTKGGAVNFCPQIIIFTSHKHPKDWYSVEAVPDTTEMMRRFMGKYGAIIEMKTPFKVEEEDFPDLKDIIDLLETGELVEQVTQIMRSQSPDPKPKDFVDLTTDDDDEVDVVKVEDYHNPYECEDCGLYPCECRESEIQHSQRLDDDDDFQEHQPPSQLRRGAWPGMPVGVSSTPPRSQAPLTFEAPLNKAGVFKRTGTEPVQSTLSFKKPRTIAGTPKKETSDDDIDDK